MRSHTPWTVLKHWAPAHLHCVLHVVPPLLMASDEGVHIGSFVRFEQKHHIFVGLQSDCVLDRLVVLDVRVQVRRPASEIQGWLQRGRDQ